MQIYSGLCVGGPHDGQWLEGTNSRWNFIESVQPLELRTSFEGTLASQIIETRQHHYLFANIRFGDQAVSYWHLSTVHPAEALKQVFEAYKGAK